MQDFDKVSWHANKLFDFEGFLHQTTFGVGQNIFNRM